MLALCTISYADTSLKEGWSAPADSREYAGRIARPSISPADSNWISFEVRQGDGVKLFIYNLEDKAPREIHAPSIESEFGGMSFQASVTNLDLAWRPTKRGGEIWAAFISNVTGNNELWLYEVNSDKYYHFVPYNDTSEVGSKSDPSWSPDGRCLTYTTRSAGNADIWMVRGLEEILKDPGDKNNMFYHEALVVGQGDQFGAVWCPVPEAAYVAYNHIGKGSGRVELRFVDPRYTSQFELVAADPSTGYFAPSWSPTGKEISYYQYDLSGSEVQLGTDMEITGDSYGLGIAGLRSDGDTLIATPLRGGGRTGTESAMLQVAPNVDRFRGPAWTPDGYQLIVSIYDEPANNPIKALIPFEWNSGGRRRDWEQNFGGGAFDFPRDIATKGSAITFTYALGQGRSLMVGNLAPQPSYVEPLSVLSVSSDRQNWYNTWSKRKSPGFFAKVGQFLFSPIGGSDFGLNRMIVPIGVVGALLLTGGGEDKITASGHNWAPPTF